MNDEVDITRHTKVADLLKNYPELEDVLIEQAPMFRKIQNPVLRKTVAKAASLEKAATMAGIQPGMLVSVLRKAAGLADSSGQEESDTDGEVLDRTTPEWAKTVHSSTPIDADKLLSGGENPIAVVTARLKRSGEEEVLKLQSSFPPIPLVEALRKKGCLVHTRLIENGNYETLILGKSLRE